MILKFKTLSKVGVFKNFNWDDNLTTSKEEAILFSKLNIIYGQNYAGKTTLSRIIRSLETGRFSENYSEANFSIECSDDKIYTNSNLGEIDYNIRVFNEDFISENIEFNNPDKAITPFAILGARNNEIEKEIERLKEILGNEEKSTGLYAIRKEYSDKYKIYSDELINAKKLLDKSLSDKATGKEIGIKYNKKYDKINYDIKALRSDIQKISIGEFTKLNDDQILSFERLINDTIKDSIKEISKPELNFAAIQESVSEIITKIVGKSDKIDALVKNAVLNRWVKEGKSLHTPDSKCGFCNGVISPNRWQELDRHFDEESENLEKKIIDLLKQIDDEEKSLKAFQLYREELFYSKFTKELNNAHNLVQRLINDYLESLGKFKTQLLHRQNNILDASDFEYTSDISIPLQQAFTELEYLRHQSNDYANTLKSDKSLARENLRLQDVNQYLREIRYHDKTIRINNLKEILFEIEQNQFSLETDINSNIKEISDNIKLMTDESKGADRINEYLEHHFGHKSLRLESIMIPGFFGDDKLVFEVQREGKKAYHLSEGEKSLIAFCYFIAKLEDIETKGTKPVIWIDDPISSLDANHIFFIYSLIKSKVYDAKDFNQLFISTHNLNFLKYLKRLPSKKDKDSNGVKYFLVERIDENSSIKEMPKYLQEHVTEFNYLFKSVFDCANIKTINDSNYTIFYNFGNNARKFLEIYLYYKYPNFENDESKYRKFFGSDPIPSILTNRLINEYSHLCGVIERGETPIDVPEMKKAAELICEKMMEKDKEQYDALVKSIKPV